MGCGQQKHLVSCHPGFTRRHKKQHWLRLDRWIQSSQLGYWFGTRRSEVAAAASGGQVERSFNLIDSWSEGKDCMYSKQPSKQASTLEISLREEGRCSMFLLPTSWRCARFFSCSVPGLKWSVVCCLCSSNSGQQEIELLRTKPCVPEGKKKLVCFWQRCAFSRKKIKKSDFH